MSIHKSPILNQLLNIPDNKLLILPNGRRQFLHLTIGSLTDQLRISSEPSNPSDKRDTLRHHNRRHNRQRNSNGQSDMPCHSKSCTWNSTLNSKHHKGGKPKYSCKYTSQSGTDGSRHRSRRILNISGHCPFSRLLCAIMIPHIRSPAAFLSCSLWHLYIQFFKDRLYGACDVLVQLLKIHGSHRILNH